MYLSHSFIHSCVSASHTPGTMLIMGVAGAGTGCSTILPSAQIVQTLKLFSVLFQKAKS